MQAMESRAHVWRAAAGVLLALACAGSAAPVHTQGVRGVARVVPVVEVGCPAAGSRPISGVRVPDLPCLGDPGRRVAIGAATGRPEVINVWASWCDPCKREAPVLEAAHRAYGDRVLFIGVDVHDERDAALLFLAASGTTYSQVFDTGARFALAVGALGLPFTLIVNASGTIVYRHIGAVTSQALRSGLARAGVTG